MKLKELLRSKTFYSGLGLVIYGAVKLANGDGSGINEIANGLAFIFIRDAIAKLKDER